MCRDTEGHSACLHHAGWESLMPWKSKAQERWGNSPSGHAALGDAGTQEWNAASKGKKLPQKASHKQPMSKPYSFPKPMLVGNMRGESHSYDHNRPKKQVVSRYAR